MPHHSITNSGVGVLAFLLVVPTTSPGVDEARWVDLPQPDSVPVISGSAQVPANDEGLAETRSLLASPTNAKRLREAIAQADAGEVEHVDLDELRERFGLPKG